MSFEASNDNIDIEFGQKENYDVCPKTEDGVHILDLKSLSYVEDFSKTTIYDFNCSCCGRSGSGTVKIENIMW